MAVSKLVFFMRCNSWSLCCPCDCALGSRGTSCCPVLSIQRDVLLHQPCGMYPAPSIQMDVSCSSHCDHEEQQLSLAPLRSLWPIHPWELLHLPQGQGLCFIRGSWLSCSPQVMLWVNNCNPCTQLKQPEWCLGESSLLTPLKVLMKIIL